MSSSGRGAGVRPGDWRLRIAESGDVRGGWLGLDGLREIAVVQNARTERHLLRPFDVLVTARAGFAQAALVPPGVSRAVAGVTLLVLRPKEPESGTGHWLYYYLTSARGRARLAKRVTVSATVRTLSAKNLDAVELPPPPSPRRLDRVARLVEASETAYTAAVEAARLRRETLRDALIDEIGAHEFSDRAAAASR